MIIRTIQSRMRKYYEHVGIVAIGLNLSISSLSASVLISQVREEGSVSSPVSGRGEIANSLDYEVVV